MYVPLPPDTLVVGIAVPLSLWDARGELLLRRGEVVVSERHRDLLLQRQPLVQDEELRAWNFRYTTELDRMVRNNQPLTKIAGFTRPSELGDRRDDDERDPSVMWPDLQSRLTTLLHRNVEAHDFSARLSKLEQRGRALVRTSPDESLFVLVQLLFDRRVNYSASHAWLCAVICQLVGPALRLPEMDQLALWRAALTMNIGMARLHDDLARQDGPLSVSQREQVTQHPQESVKLLQAMGVGDRLWLELVQDHHEVASGAGYPSGKRVLHPATQLLRMSDVFVARISPRHARAGLPPSMAARDVYLGANGKPSEHGAAFVKTLGVYIPGSYVRLANGEIAVVARRGGRANPPVVFSVIGRQGSPLGEPSLRDTSDREHEIRGSVPAEEVRVRVNAAKLFSRL
jgi:HD-GYP domain-containing protein (c-di-GMP phosphodiesterase class II)